VHILSAHVALLREVSFIQWTKENSSSNPKKLWTQDFHHVQYCAKCGCCSIHKNCSSCLLRGMNYEPNTPGISNPNPSSQLQSSVKPKSWQHYANLEQVHGHKKDAVKQISKQTENNSYRYGAFSECPPGWFNNPSPWPDTSNAQAQHAAAATTLRQNGGDSTPVLGLLPSSYSSSFMGQREKAHIVYRRTWG
jgi:hypothetical protein